MTRRDLTSTTTGPTTPSPAPDATPPGEVTEIIRRRVSAGQQARFEAWVAAVDAESSASPGYLGAVVLRPAPSQPENVVVLRFADRTARARWHDDPSRAARVREVDAFSTAATDAPTVGRVAWFSPRSDAAGAGAPRWKQVVVLTVVLFALTQTIPPLLGPALATLPTWLAALANVALLVALLTYVVMPLVGRLLGRWLAAPGLGAART